MQTLTAQAKITELARIAEAKEQADIAREQEKEITKNVHAGSDPNQQVTELDLTISTGGDDLRSDSVATAFVILAGNNQTERVTSDQLNLDSQGNAVNWPNYSINSCTFQLTSKLFNPILIKNIKTFGIDFASYGSFPETGDNWNMNGITVTYPPNGDALLTESGNPLKRFKSDTDEWSQDMF